MTPPTIRAISTTEDRLTFELDGDRVVSIPISMSARLQRATAIERERWTIDPRGIYAHWPDVDEDIAVWEILGIAEDAYLKSFHEAPVG